MFKKPTLLSEECVQNPYPVYEEMRSQGPIYWDEEAQAWCVLDANLITQILADHERYSSDHLAHRAEPVLGAKVLAQMEGHEHDEKKICAMRALSKIAMDGYYLPAVEKVCASLIAETASQPEFDFVEDVACPFAWEVTCALLGIENDWKQQVLPWNRSIVEFITLLHQSENERTKRLRDAGFFRAFMLRLLEARRIHPRHDVLSYLATEGSKYGLDDAETVALALNILLAASEPLDKTLSYMVYEALRHPEVIQQIKTQPSLLQAFIAEVLRLHPPVQVIPRICTSEVTLHSSTIKTADTLYCLIGAAHRDPARFDNPETFDIGRQDNSPAKAFSPLATHLSFGHGIHFCIGSMLAKRQLEAAFRSCLPHLETWQLSEQMLLEHGLYTRGPVRMLLTQKSS